MDLRGIVRAAPLMAAAAVWSVGAAFADGAAGTVADTREGKTWMAENLRLVYTAESIGMPDSLSATYDMFTDERDGKKYRAAKMPDGKVWMVWNLNYQPKPGKSWCYEDSHSYCKKYGRLYDWNTARTVCPTGWHLPSRGEWDSLVTAVGGKNTAGQKLKTRSGDWKWYERDSRTLNEGDSVSGNGTNDYKFSALPGGYRNSDGKFNAVGRNGYWWTATDINGGFADYRGIYYNGGNVHENYDYKSNGFSVRCVADAK